MSVRRPGRPEIDLTAYFLIGAQGSGKSTWARRNAERLQALVVASDDIRNELDAAGIDAEFEGDRVFAILEDRVARYMEAGRSVIVDATHARRKWREKVIAIARKRGARVVAVWFDLPLEVCLARNAGRPGGGWGDRVVPPPVLESVWRGAHAPSLDEFDEIIKISA